MSRLTLLFSLAIVMVRVRISIRLPRTLLFSARSTIWGESSCMIMLFLILLGLPDSGTKFEPALVIARMILSPSYSKTPSPVLLDVCSRAAVLKLEQE